VAARKRNVILAVLTRFAVVIVLLVASVAIFALLVMTRTEPATVDPSAVLPRIAVMEVSRLPIGRQWQGFGTAAPAPGGAANVPAQVRGVVADVPREVVAGAAVRRGQLLVRLDDADFRDEVEHIAKRIDEIDSQIEQLQVEFRAMVDRLELAQEDITIARADLDRILDAQQRGSATQREVDQLRTALLNAQRNESQVREQLDRIEPRHRQLRAIRAQQETALRSAQRNLARCTITSPIDGILQSVEVERGESVGMDQRIARVVDLRRIEVPVRLPAEARGSVRPGDEAIVTPAGAGNREWAAVISRIAPEDDQQTRTVTVYVEIEQNPESVHERLLTPGTFVSVVVNSADVRERMILPRRAVQGGRAWVVDDENRLRSRRVNVVHTLRGTFPELGIDDQDWVVVNEPFPPGSRVVLDGARSLVEGTRIEPVIAEIPVASRPDAQPAEDRP
jgi:RND family efflux transporter MFP subunit